MDAEPKLKGITGTSSAPSRIVARLAPAVALLTALSGCASVPKEVVELSYQMGQDISGLSESYDKLIHEHFEQLRAQRVQYLDQRWTPRYLSRWIKDGKLVEVAKGELVWSPAEEDFVKPSAGNSQAEMLATVREWSEWALIDIAEKRDELLGPLDKDEESLRGAVGESFQRILSANQHVTAHLNSLRKVQAVQDDVLKALNVKDLRDSINSALIDASRKADEGLKAIEKVDGFVDKAEDVRDSLGRKQPKEDE